MKVIEGMHGRHGMSSLLQDIMQDNIQLWAVVIDRQIKAVIGTHLRDYPTGVRTCCIDFAGGAGFRRWVEPVLETIEEYARFNECQRVETFARKGWAKYMQEYKLTHVHMEKELD